MLGSPTITTKGLNLLAKIVANNEPLKLSYIGLGDGIQEESESVTALSNEIMKKEIEKCEYNEKEGQYYIRRVFTNAELEEGFYIREVGVYAIDPDEGEILYAYTNAGEAGVDYFAPGKGKVVVKEIIEMATKFGNADEITVMIDPSVALVTEKEFNERVDDLQKQIDEHKTEYEELKDDVKQLSSPNILTNGGFGVNQRNQVTYSEHGKYTVDRWSIFKEDNSTNTSTLEVIEDGIKLNIKESGIYCKQPIEPDYINKLRGNNITASLYIKGENLEEGVFYIQLIGNDEQNNLIQKVKTINYTDIESEYKRIDISLFLESAVNIKTFRFEFGTSKNVGNGKLNNGAIIYAKNAKLEIGDKATPFYPRSFGEELALCKRYFRRIRQSESAQSESALGTSVIIGMGKVASISSKQVIIIVPGETEMRIAPSVSWNGKLNITFDDKTVSTATVGQALIIGSSLLLRLTSASTPSHTHLFAYADLNSLDGKNVGYMDFDSEIY